MSKEEKESKLDSQYSLFVCQLQPKLAEWTIKAGFKGMQKFIGKLYPFSHIGSRPQVIKLHHFKPKPQRNGAL